MTKTQLAVIAILVLLNLVVIGGAGIVAVSTLRPLAAIPPPTEVALEPTSTPTSAPTTTPTAEPTATLVNSGNAAIQMLPEVRSALDKTRDATTFHLESNITMSGDLGQLAPGAAKNQEFSLMSINGDFAGKDSHFTIKGFVGAFFTGDPAKGVEFTEVGGKTYIRGPAPLLGAKDNRWYLLGASQAASAQSTFQTTSFLSSFVGKDSNLSALAPAGTETLDKIKCTVYAASTDAALNAFLSLGSTSQISPEEWDTVKRNIRNSEYKLWICDDGYLHQVRIAFDGQGVNKASDVFGITFTMRARDFGSKVSIVAPASAIPATSPFLVTPAPPRN